mmetsp:Transcript_937/g.2159  ORF Transcript_937/g.2159 Transcript_937/m.2159 type:complete len:483 (+) Transcript_937:96-1544(+)
MRVSSIGIATLSLNGAIWFAEGNRPVIDPFEVFPIRTSATTPMGTVSSLDPLQGQVYFETNAATALDPTDVNYIPVTIELFANSPLSGFCDGGYRIDTGSSRVQTKYFKMLENETSYKAYDANKRTSDGIIGVSRFIIDNFETPLLTSGPPTSVYSKKGTDETIDICVRSSIQKDFNAAEKGLDYVSYMDSHFTVNITVKDGVFSALSTSVTKPNVKEQGTTSSKTISVESFVCSDDDIQEFNVGQNFQICVQPTAQYASQYSIKSIKNVTCKNAFDSKLLVATDGPTDSLTTIIESNGIQSIDKTKKAGPSSKGIKSVVTAGFFGKGATSFSCSGEAVFNITRRLTHDFLRNSDGEHLRGLQETTATQGGLMMDGSFASVIRLVSDVGNGDVGIDVGGSEDGYVGGPGQTIIDVPGEAVVDYNPQNGIPARDFHPGNQLSKSPSIEIPFIQASPAFAIRYFEWSSRFMVGLTGVAMVVVAI